MGGDQETEKVVLVIGACCLDRLLTVTSYPQADAKVRTTAYHELGGGNAGNTASTMGLLNNASSLGGSNNTKIKMLTKLGDDSVGSKLVHDLTKAGVDLSSPLFQLKAGSTTSLTTIIVSEKEHTRSCLHTPGTCGELTMEDFHSVELDEVFENVVLFHSDGRHTNVANALAKEARRRGIVVTVDPEKDRNMAAQDELMELSTTLFTNSDQMDSYFERRNTAMENDHGRLSLMKPKIKGSLGNTSNTKALANSIKPSAFYSRWHVDMPLHKEVVLTQGKWGAIRVITKKVESWKEVPGETEIVLRDTYPIIIDHKTRERMSQFEVETTGVVQDVNIVDSTGAGDAFIGGYLSIKLLYPNDSQLALQFGAWVAGKKLEGPGAQSALPKGITVDEELGHTRDAVERSLKYLIGPFGG